MSLLIKTPDVPPVSATEVISLTQQLIRFNSVSGNEREIAIFVQEYFEKRGISARIVEPVRNRPIADGIKAPCAVIAEPTELQTICAAKGNCYFTIRASGRAAHAGSPELGVNAIGAAAKLALAVARHDQETGIRSHPLLGRPYSTV